MVHCFAAGSPVIVNGDEFENIEITSVSDDGGAGGNEKSGSVRDLHRHHQRPGKPHKSAKDTNLTSPVQDFGGAGDTGAVMPSSDWSKNASPRGITAGQQQQLPRQHQQAGPLSCDIIVTDVEQEGRAHQSQGDMLREMVKNKVNFFA